jgi:ParB family chromosome partitioning protein
VREVAADVKRILDGPRPMSAPEVPPHVAALEERLRERLGTRVGVRPGKGEKGRIVIEYFSRAELTRIVDLLSSGAFAAEPIVD